MNRRAFIKGFTLAALSQSDLSAYAMDATNSGGDGEQVTWTRYAAKQIGARPSVFLLHGTRGFELSMPAYERYANALNANGIDAYFVHFYAAGDSEKLKSLSTGEERDAYSLQRYAAWAERVSSVITTILKGGNSSDKVGLLGFSLGGFVAATAAARDTRVSALAVLYGGMPENIVADVKRMPPLIELHGDADTNVPVATGAALVALAKGLGSSAEQVTYPGRNHGFDFSAKDPAASNAIDRVAHFFDTHLQSV